MMNKSLDWSACVAALTDDDLQKLAKWRGYSPEFCTWLREAQLIGLHDRHIAFPLADEQGAVGGCHYRIKDDGSWRYFPTGLAVRPLVIGKPSTAAAVHVSESPWDLLALLDRLGWHLHEDGPPDTAGIATRGAGNGKLVAGLCPPGAVAYAWPQNDPPNLKTRKVPGDEWFKDVAAHCGCKLVRASTPAPHKDVNDWTKAGATADAIWQAVRQGQAAVESEPPAVAVTEFEPQEDTAPSPFPTVSLPPTLREFVAAVAAAHRVPEALPACCALAATAAVIGPALELVSGPEQQRTRANIYVLPSADSGSGKSKVFKTVLAPRFDHEAELLERWRKVDGPRKEAEETALAKQIDELKKDVKKQMSDDDRERLIAALAHPKARLEELKNITAPRLVCQDATIEALGVRLAQNRECLFSACADARKLADNLLGRNNPGKMVDDSIYLQAFSGDSIVVDRQSRDTISLREPCLTLLWLVQPDIVEKLLGEASLQVGGFLARLLICHTNASPPEWTSEVTGVPDALRQQWTAFILDLLKGYWLAGARHTIAVPLPVWERFREYHDPIVRRVNHADLADLKAYAMRWTEQAMRLSLIHHVGLWGICAHEHPLSLESAEAGIAIGQWFAEQQMQMLARGRQEARRKLEDRVLALIDERQDHQQGDYVTARIVQNRHITRIATEAQALLAQMDADGILCCEPIHRPEGGHVERRYLRLAGRNPLPA